MMSVIRVDGLIDPHTHLRDFLWRDKATFTSETQAAVAAGYWAVFDMPNTPPTTTNPVNLNYKLWELERKSHCDWGVYFGAANIGEAPEYENIVSHVCGLKIYNNETTGDLLIDEQDERERHYKSWFTNRIIAVHAEGKTVGEILSLVRKYRQPTHFLHISSAYEIRLLTEAKEEGLPISIGVCPHHLFLTLDDLAHLGPYGLMKPELKTKLDQRALWDAIDSGVVDIIESDHAPHTRHEKMSKPPPYGVPGLETTLPLMLSAVHEGRIPLKKAIRMQSFNVQRIWKVTPPLKTYTLIDTSHSFIIDRKNLRSKCDWTPFDGMRGYGKILEVWIRGHKVFDGENVLSQPGFGTNLFGLTSR